MHGTLYYWTRILSKLCPDERRPLDTLLAGGVIERLAGFVNGEAGVEELEASGREHLESGAGRSAGISGPVFEGVNKIIQTLRAPFQASRALNVASIAPRSCSVKSGCQASNNRFTRGSGLSFQLS